jgi:magnesium chelatase family protein
MLIAAANPCRCGHMFDPAQACARVPDCGNEYLGRLSGPLLDRLDLRIEVPPVAFHDLDLPADGESSATVSARVAQAQIHQTQRYADAPSTIRSNADAGGQLLEEVTCLDSEGRDLLSKIAARFGLSARGYHRVLRVARTIADLDNSETVRRPHLAEAISFRLSTSQEV